MRTVRIIIFLLSLMLSAKAGSAQSDSLCMSCHFDTALVSVTYKGDTVSAYVDTSLYHAGTHYKNFLLCISCHLGASENPHPEDLPLVDCISSCHPVVSEIDEHNRHIYLIDAGIPNAPDCYHCHGTHYVFPATDKRSYTHPDNIMNSCNSCHSPAPFIIPVNSKQSPSSSVPLYIIQNQRGILKYDFLPLKKEDEVHIKNPDNRKE